jgi:hypothetical protein
MRTQFRTAQLVHTGCLVRTGCLALALAGVTGPALAQTWVYEQDYGARVYRPRAVYQERYIPRVYNSYAPAYNSYAYEPVVSAPVVSAPAVAVAPIQRTVVTRTIIPQGRGRGPIVKERIVSERTGPIVTRPAAVGFAYRPAVTDAYALAPLPAPRVVRRPVVVDYGPRVTESYALAPIAQPIVTTVQPYRYINNRFIVIDPVTGGVVSEVED